jgi:hypothetical protein
MTSKKKRIQQRKNYVYEWKCLSCCDTGDCPRCQGDGCMICKYTGKCPLCQDIEAEVKIKACLDEGKEKSNG